MEIGFSEGARRALDRAAHFAALAEAAEISPCYLLWALWDDESRAAEILAESGVSRDVIQRHWPLSANAGGAQGRASESVPKNSPGESVQQIIEQARGFVALTGRHGEVGSEHLLWALAKVDSPVAELLRRYNLDDGSLASRAAETTGFSDDPIAVDFDIRRAVRTETDQTDTLRVIDAAANRAREGLRVVEDFVRFTLDDAHLTGLLKHCRHQLTAALTEIAPGRLLAARDTVGDVGTTISTAAEVSRGTPLDVVRANFKRVQEAARTLEEFGKILSADIGRVFEQMRYDLYTLEKAVLLTDLNRRRLAGCHLYLLATESLCHHGSGPAIRESLAAGVGIVQIREKTWGDRKLLEHARYVREWTHASGALLIINDRPDLAVLSDADGVHVGQEELSVREARRIVGPDRLIGVSTHTIEQARRAVLDGADYLGVGPVFSSTTKDFDNLAGLEFVRQVAAEISLPWFAIGGIDTTNIHQLIAAGATRAAVSGAICGSENPREVATGLLTELRRAESTSTKHE